MALIARVQCPEYFQDHEKHRSREVCLFSFIGLCTPPPLRPRNFKRYHWFELYVYLSWPPPKSFCKSDQPSNGINRCTQLGLFSHDWLYDYRLGDTMTAQWLSLSRCDSTRLKVRLYIEHITPAWLPLHSSQQKRITLHFFIGNRQHDAERQLGKNPFF